MTTTEPNAGEERRGRHAKTEQDGHEAADERQEQPADDEGATPDDEPEDDKAKDDEPEHDEHEDDDSGGDEPDKDKDKDKASDDDRAEEPEPDVPEPPQPAPPRTEDRPRETREERKPSQLHAIAHHPAGSSLLMASGLITGLALVPLLFGQLTFEVANRAADAARSASAPWPAGGEPWFWPGWLAMLAAVVAVAVIVVGALGVRLPDLVVLVTAVVLAVATARAAWATIDVLNAHLWELIPACLVCVGAFGSAVGAVFRWRSGESTATGAGTGEVAGVTLGAWLLVVLLFLGGSAIASSARTHAFGNVTSPPQDLAGLLSVRAADAPQVDDLRGGWAAQVGAAQVKDDAAATAYAVVHNGFTTKFPTVLARGDDVGDPGVDDTWWLSLAAQRFGSQQEAAAWCSSSGVQGCSPRKIGG